jgi:hypothetical protein
VADQPTHDCPGGCGTQVLQSMLACRKDWFRLPEGLRRAVNFWYPRRRTHPGQHRDAVAAALAWYRDNPPVREVPGG